MSPALKKILVLLPVVLLGLIYLKDHAFFFDRASKERILFLALSFFVLYGWILLEVFIRKQSVYFDIAVQASFFLYVLIVSVSDFLFTISR